MSAEKVLLIIEAVLLSLMTIAALYYLIEVIRRDIQIRKTSKIIDKAADKFMKKIDEAVKFRNSPKWQKKRRKIKERDSFLCQVCIRELYGTRRKYTYENLEVHHAIPISKSEELKLDDNNLITLCSFHHSMCEKGRIPYEEIQKIINEQNKSIN